MTLAAEQLNRIAPLCTDTAGWAAALNAAATRYGIDQNPEDFAEFIAQCAFESSQFTTLAENLNYKPDRLVAVFPKEFPTVADAATYAGNSPKLANRIYANRWGNGDEASGDGYRYRGRGVLQTTFKDNYQDLQRLLGIPVVACPDMLCTKTTAALAAAVFWKTHGAIPLASDGKFQSVTKLINSSEAGLKDREVFLARAHQALA